MQRRGASAASVQNGSLARHISQAGWNQIIRRLRDKCEWHRRTLVIVDKWFPSSQRCSECGHVDGKKPLGVRDWTCSECGTCHDRDINAAKNLSGALADPNSSTWRPGRTRRASGRRFRSMNNTIPRQATAGIAGGEVNQSVDTFSP
ncbi:zinc ribbon domain-containing protein [Salinibacter ruber]|uniref:zinc ribbon domain-containing protein n=1 Tax=Salinibacter ruber TaxID=146919 RepID=UPI002342CFE7